MVPWLAFLSLLTIPAGFLGQLRSRLARGGLTDIFRELPRCAAPNCSPPSRARSGTPG